MIVSNTASKTFAGTHNVRNISIVTENENIEISTLFSPHSAAKGALYIFVPIKETGETKLNKSTVLPIARATGSYTLTTPLGGSYAVLVYDIESDGLLQSGVGYPSTRRDNLFLSSEKFHGNYCYRNPFFVSSAQTKNCYMLSMCMWWNMCMSKAACDKLWFSL